MTIYGQLQKCKIITRLKEVAKQGFSDKYVISVLITDKICTNTKHKNSTEFSS